MYKTGGKEWERRLCNPLFQENKKNQENPSESTSFPYAQVTDHSYKLIQWEPGHNHAGREWRKRSQDKYRLPATVLLQKFPLALKINRIKVTNRRTPS